MLGPAAQFRHDIKVQFDNCISGANMGFQNAFDVALHVSFAIFTRKFFAGRNHSALAVDDGDAIGDRVLLPRMRQGISVPWLGLFVIGVQSILGGQAVVASRR